jgi:branched-subunit amino acid ABC-type transport system permease component
VTATLAPEAPPPPPEPERPVRLNAFQTAVRSSSPVARTGRAVAAAVGFVVVVQFFFGMSAPNFINGISLGSLYGIIAVALILIYRTNRIINFAAAAVGAVPAIYALLLDVQDHVNYLTVLPIAVFGGLLFGALIDVVVMRRFAKSPRLIVTVVTLGVAQSLAAIGYFIPIWMGAKAAQIPNVPTPWHDFAIHNGRGQPVLTGDQVAALLTVVFLSGALAAFLRYTRMGIALRASAENADRASLLGIPVKRVGMVAWMIAGLFASVAIFVQAPLVGVPNDATLGFDTLLYALAAAVVARMERIWVALAAGMGIGVLIFASVAREGDNNLASALMLLVILAALLLQRGSMSRAYDTGVATWQAVKMFRPIPLELRSVREVVAARAALYAVGGFVILICPLWVSQADMNQLVTVPLWGIVAVSLVVLTGWAGQISLGQFGLVGAGAAVAGGLAANHNIDFFLALAIGTLAGVVAAVIIGLPAVRIQGLYLAATTLAFGYAMWKYVLNRHYWLGKILLPAVRAHRSREQPHLLLRGRSVHGADSAGRPGLPAQPQRSCPHRRPRQPASSVRLRRQRGAHPPRRLRRLRRHRRVGWCAVRLPAAQRHRRQLRHPVQHPHLPRRGDRRAHVDPVGHLRRGIAGVVPAVRAQAARPLRRRPHHCHPAVAAHGATPGCQPLSVSGRVS